MKSFTTITEYVNLKTEPTRKSYLAALGLLAQFLGAEPRSDILFEKMTQMKGSDAARFYTFMRGYVINNGRALSDASVSQRLHLIRKLFRYLVAIEEVTRNPFDAVHYEIPKRQRRQIRPTKLVPFGMIEKILSLCDTSTKKGTRDYCLLGALFGGGLRRSEAFHLNVGDIKVTSKGTLYLSLNHTKNGSNQEQSLPPWAAEAFTRLVSQRYGDGATNEDPLFIFYAKDGRPRERLSDATIYRTYKRYLAKVGLKDYAPHSARATAATWLKTEGVEDRDVAAFLRHTTVQMVQTYDKRLRSPETNAGLKINFKRAGSGDD